MDLRESLAEALGIALHDADWDLYDCDGPDNTDRANWGRAAWAAHQSVRDHVTATAVDAPLGYEIADVICDLLHLADAERDREDESGGALAVLASALGNYAAEVVHLEYCRACQGDERHGDRWTLRLDRTGRIATFRAEECRVLEYPESEPPG